MVYRLAKKEGGEGGLLSGLFDAGEPEPAGELDEDEELSAHKSNREKLKSQNMPPIGKI